MENEKQPEFTLAEYAVQEPFVDSKPRPTRPRKQAARVSGPFIKGPISLGWIGKAATAQPRGKCLHVALALVYLSGLTRSDTVPLKPSVLERLGVERSAGYRALTALEEAGLVAVDRHRGRAPLVTLLGLHDEAEHAP